ncbi:coproporphyrinogen III oxidase and related Fe-S oxidoreductase [Candidatus Scalindua japonica]|uniref:Heme chaperone HemW n=1 Tax=Candidatus Scalindua japonica TaxID=1284222 RepID=A0A286U3E2_9BACT|nr:radical SAM family heme chaperone HemW [Candidatus Scalindua japonica]GAX62644.1 coproporphyrinogen III oxidase and related Fe-S oxidoreductase [Candidatus Scalindua japonica]
MIIQHHIPSLYIHIPFCISKCIYCDFNSIVTNSQVVDEYLGTIEEELQSTIKKYSFKTVFIGGGTPTVLNETQLDRLLSAVTKYVDIPNLKEYTIEVNPGTLSDEKAIIMKNSHVNRVSIGIQSFNDRYLKLLGRIHSANEAKDIFSNLRAKGFNNLSVDMIYGYPAQTLNEWQKELEECCGLGPEHISAYCLTYEQGTPIVEMTNSGALNKLSEEEELKMYEFTNDFLCDKGYNHYEISNFAKQGKECRHNTVYWENREYIGIGAGAFSYVHGERYSNIKNVKEYISSAKSKKRLKCFSEKLPQKQRASEILIMALRMTSGISRKDFIQRSGFDLNELFQKQLDNLTQAGLINFDDERVKLTRKGLSLADSVMTEFM